MPVELWLNMARTIQNFWTRDSRNWLRSREMEVWKGGSLRGCLDLPLHAHVWLSIILGKRGRHSAPGVWLSDPAGLLREEGCGWKTKPPCLGQGDEAHCAESSICHIIRSWAIGKPSKGSPQGGQPGKAPLKGLDVASQVLLAESESENTHQVCQAMRLPESRSDLFKVTG